VIARLIKENAQKLYVPEGLCAEAILWAVYRCEKYAKHSHVPRFEKAYTPGGYYYERSEMVRQEYERWGSWAACSYSNFQILYITARELGYDGPPLALDKDSVALPFVVKLLRRIISRGAVTPEEIADAYNSGTHKDKHVPEKYIKKFVRFYEEYACIPETKEKEETSTSPASIEV